MRIRGPKPDPGAVVRTLPNAENCREVHERTDAPKRTPHRPPDAQTPAPQPAPPAVHVLRGQSLGLLLTRPTVPGAYSYLAALEARPVRELLRRFSGRAARPVSNPSSD